MNLTAKQESFCREFFKSHDGQASAIFAGYSPLTARFIAAENLTKPNIVKRLNELETIAKTTAGDAVMDVVERQKRLSELGRAKLVDFLDGAEPKQNLTEVANNGALSEIVVRTRYNKDGEASTERSIKLRDPVAAIAELNKMDHVYEDKPGTNITYQAIVFMMPDGSQWSPKELLDGNSRPAEDSPGTG